MKMKKGGNSVTQNLMKRDVQVDLEFANDPSFTILDGPGDSSSINKMQHACHIRALLSTYPLNTVNVCVKFETRFDLMLQAYEKSILPLRTKDRLRAQKYEETLTALKGSLNHRRCFE